MNTVIKNSNSDELHFLNFSSLSKQDTGGRQKPKSSHHMRVKVYETQRFSHYMVRMVFRQRDIFKREREREGERERERLTVGCPEILLEMADLICDDDDGE